MKELGILPKNECNHYIEGKALGEKGLENLENKRNRIQDRSVWCFTESMCGRDSELVNSGCRSRPGTLSPPRSFLLQGKADTRWSQHFPPTYPKPGTELSSECHRGWRCQYTEGSSPREAITKRARTATKQGACAVCQALC